MQDGQLPKVVMDLLRLLKINGPYTQEVFRKSCNVELAKEIHQKLDEGMDCVDEETPTLVLGNLLKDYLRNLPHCLLYEELYEEWINLGEEEDTPQKLEKAKGFLERLPDGHRDFLKHLLCVLYHIDKNHNENMMTAYNLSVCIAPSILWAKQRDDPVRIQVMAKSPQQIVEYLIINCVELFEEEIIFLFEDLLEHTIRETSSTDSDSLLSMANLESFVVFQCGRSMLHDDPFDSMFSSPVLNEHDDDSDSITSYDSGLSSSQEYLENGSKNRVNATFVKSRSDSHVEDEPLTYPSEITRPLTKLSLDSESQIQRKKFVAQSTPPTSPQPMLFHSSSDDPQAYTRTSFLNRVYGKDTDISNYWSTAENSFREAFDSARGFKDDLSINFQKPNHVSATMQKSAQNIQYSISFPVSSQCKRRSSSLDLSQTKSYPLLRTCFSQEKLSHPLSARYGQSAMDLSHSTNPLK